MKRHTVKGNDKTEPESVYCKKAFSLHELYTSLFSSIPSKAKK
jgi:hypothetical protein